MPDETRSGEHLGVDGERFLAWDTAQAACRGVLGDAAHVDDLVLDPATPLEATQLGYADVDGGLAALEPGRDAGSRTGALALGAATRRLALAGSDAATDAGATPGRARCGLELVELHDAASFFLLAEVDLGSVEAFRLPPGGGLTLVEADSPPADPSLRPADLDPDGVATGSTSTR
jgi:hypothetical protein